MPALDVGESIECEVTFTRTALTPIASFTWDPSPGLTSAGIALMPSRWAVGVFDDPSISVEPVNPLPFLGATEEVFRIAVTNPGNAALTNVEAGGCQFFSSSMVTMDADIPGGCGASAIPNVLCFTGFSGFSVAIPDVPAHSQSSCLVRARRPSGLIEGTGWPFELFVQQNSVTETGYQVGDSNYDNNIAELVIGFQDASPIPALSVRGALGLCFILGCLAFVHLVYSRSKGLS